MAERYVRMNILSTGGDKAKATLDELAMKARKLEAESPELKITADDTKFEAMRKQVQLKIDILNRQKAEIAMETKGDEVVKAKLLDISAALRKLDETVAKPKVGVEGLERAEARLIRLKLLMDSLHDKRVSVNVSEHRSMLSRLAGFLGGVNGGGGGGGGGAASGFGSDLLSSLGGASNSLTGIGIGGAIVAALSVAPALIPLLLGGGIGAGAGAGAFALGSKANQQIQALAKSLPSGHTAADKAKTKQIEAQMAAIRKANGPELNLFGALSDTGHSLLGTFGNALKSRPLLKRGGTGPGGHGEVRGQSFMGGVTDIVKQFGGFTKSLGPGLGEMFRASLPFIKMFVDLLEKSAKILMPVFTQSMKQLTPLLPTLEKGFLLIVQGLAGFIKAMGPGMKDATTVFIALMTGVKGIMIGVGYLARYLAEFFAKWGHNVKEGVISIGHAFEDMWNWFKKTWDNIMSGWHSFKGSEQKILHSIAADWDAFRHDVAAIWDAMWRNVINSARADWSIVVNFFKRIGSGIWDALRHLPGQLWNLAKDMVENLWKGAKSVASKVTGFFTGLGHGIMNALHSVFHFGSPSKTMFQLGQWIVEGLHKGIQNKMGTLQGGIHAMGKNVASWLGQALAIAHKPMSWLPAMEMLVSKESGGNPRAVNPISVLGQHATGLLQTLPSTFASYSLGGSIYDPVANAVASLRYISANYGSPFNIPGLFGGNYRGYAMGGMITEPIIGAGLRTGTAYSFGEVGPEYVSPAGSGGYGGGNTYHIHNHVAPNANMAEIGRVTVDAIRQFERRSGNSWRK